MDATAQDTPPFPADSKICRLCRRMLPLGAFYRYAGSRDGLNTRCKDCLRSYSRERYRTRRSQQPRSGPVSDPLPSDGAGGRMETDEQPKALGPVTVPALVLRLVLSTAFMEGVTAGTRCGYEAGHETEARVHTYLARILAEAEHERAVQWKQDEGQP